jgi:hypothetical protein
MTKTLPSTSWIARTALKIVKAVGPLSAEASEAFAQHQLRMAQVEACKELMLGEVRTYTEIRRKLAERLYETPEGDRFRVKRDLEYLNGEILCLGVYQKALDYLPKYSEQPNAPSAPERDISPSWLDRFNELARLHNEPWREDLLSRALAWEAENPGSVSPRALFQIALLETI